MKNAGGRRGLIVSLVFLAAVLSQVFAPAAASLAMARAFANPLASAVVCDEARRASGQTPSPGLPPSRDECCQLCQFVHSGGAPLPPQISVFGRQTPGVSRIAWSAAAQAPRDGARWPHAHARAPPQIS